MVKEICRRAIRISCVGMQYVRIFVLQGPVLLALRLFPISFDYVFFVYPGTDSDMDKFVPRYFAKNLRHRTRMILCGFITKPQNAVVGRGLIIAAPSTVRTMVKFRENCELLEQRLQKIAQNCSVKTIAIAGRGASIFLRHNILLEHPFVHGEKGMVFCTIMTLEAVVDKYNLSLRDIDIVIFGAGRIGQSITDFLLTKKSNVVTVTAQTVFDVNNVKVRDRGVDKLCKADIVIVISAKGSDIYPYMKYLKNDAIIIDDTHPRMHKQFDRGVVYRASLALDGVHFKPSLPKYDSDSIPGCMLEAMVCARYGTIESQEAFNEKARTIGFHVRGIT